jgi:hypothetical protein
MTRSRLTKIRENPGKAKSEFDRSTLAEAQKIKFRVYHDKVWLSRKLSLGLEVSMSLSSQK